MRLSLAILGLALALVVAGCAYQAEVVTSTSDQITIKAGQYANPGGIAKEHCAQHGKNAVLSENAGGYFTFNCTPTS